MGNELNPGGRPKTEKASPAPTEVEFLRRQNAEQEERLRAAEADRVDALRFAATTGRQPPPPAPPMGPPPPDPFGVFAGSPDLRPHEVTGLLDQGVRGRIREEMSPVLDTMARRFDQVMTQREINSAYQRTMADHPDLAADPRGYIAASSAVEYELRRHNTPVGPDQFQALVVDAWREMFNHPVPSAPHIEGAGGPTDIGRGGFDPKDLPPEGASIEKLYSLPPGSVMLHKGDPAVFDKITRDYVRDKNRRLAPKEKGAVGFRTNVNRIHQEMREADKADAAGGQG